MTQHNGISLYLKHWEVHWTLNSKHWKVHWTLYLKCWEMGDTLDIASETLETVLEGVETEITGNLFFFLKGSLRAEITTVKYSVLLL